MRRGDGRLELCPLPTSDQVQLSALLQGVGGVGVNEAQTIAAGPQLMLALGAVPVLVTAVEVRIEALMAVGTGEVISLTMDLRQSQHQPESATHVIMSEELL